MSDAPMTDEYDVAIVGARIAGSISAILLGEAGLHVLLVDAAAFPSDTISTHFFRGAGLVAVLQRLGVLDAVLALGAPPLTREYLYQDGADPIVGDPQEPGEIGYSLSVRRTALDRLLLERARLTPGVDVRESTTVRGLLHDGDRVSGIVTEQQRRTIPVRARLVLGADGRGSLVARLVAAQIVRREPASRAMYFRYVRDYGGVEGRRDGPEFSFRGDELVYAFPSDDDVTCLAVSINLDAFKQFRSAPEAAFEAALRRHPGIAPRFAVARPDSRVLGSGPKDAIVRQPSGPGWALVGDAGLHQDPWTGLGMDNAAAQATFLTEAVSGWLGGRVTEEAAFQTYGRRRDEVAMPGFEFTASGGRDLSRL